MGCGQGPQAGIWQNGKWAWKPQALSLEVPWWWEQLASKAQGLWSHLECVLPAGKRPHYSCLLGGLPQELSGPILLQLCFLLASFLLVSHALQRAELAFCRGEAAAGGGRHGRVGERGTWENELAS